jgi:hypothetical protein
MADANGSTTQAQPVPDVEELTASRAVLYPLLFGFAGSFVLRTAVVLGLPDIIARAGPDETLTVKQIAAQLKSESVNENGLQRVLTALVNWKLFRCTKADLMSEMQYGLTPISKLLVTENNPYNQAPAVLLHTDPAILAPWQQLHRYVLYGENAFQSTYGKVVQLCPLSANHTFSSPCPAFSARMCFSCKQFRIVPAVCHFLLKKLTSDFLWIVLWQSTTIRSRFWF